jgi:HSP20 family protein
MDQVLQRFFGEGSDGGNGNGLTAWAPRVDVEEDDKQYVVRADLPGVDPKDVEITVADNALVIRGQSKQEREEKDKNYHRIERIVGQFYREIPLPREIDADKIRATTANGVLTVTIPKKAEAQPKKITVQPEKQGDKQAEKQSMQVNNQSEKQANKQAAR